MRCFVVLLLAVALHATPAASFASSLLDADADADADAAMSALESLDGAAYEQVRLPGGVRLPAAYAASLGEMSVAAASRVRPMMQWWAEHSPLPSLTPPNGAPTAAANQPASVFAPFWNRPAPTLVPEAAALLRSWRQLFARNRGKSQREIGARMLSRGHADVARNFDYHFGANGERGGDGRTRYDCSSWYSRVLRAVQPSHPWSLVPRVTTVLMAADCERERQWKPLDECRIGDVLLMSAARGGRFPTHVGIAAGAATTCTDAAECGASRVGHSALMMLHMSSALDTVGYSFVSNTGARETQRELRCCRPYKTEYNAAA